MLSRVYEVEGDGDGEDEDEGANCIRERATDSRSALAAFDVALSCSSRSIVAEAFGGAESQ